MKTRFLLAACAAAACVSVPIAAWAVPVITWSYSTNATFTSATFGSGSGSQTQTSDALTWGATGGDFQVSNSDSSQNQSALTIGTGTTGSARTGGGPATGNINTTFGGSPDPLLGQVANGTTFTHWNNALDSDFATLTGGVVHDTLSLTGTDPNPPYPGGPITVSPIDFTFNFRETPNNPGNPPGCAGGTAEPCADLFGIVGTPNLNVPFSYTDPSSAQVFNYLASIFVLGPGGGPSPIGTLLPGECQALGLSTGCQGFRTAEGAQTTVQFGFAITTEPIVQQETPEPATLVLLGVGLAALGFATRRRIF